MPDLKFQPWPKIHRLYRDIIITEKIDGTNSAIVIDRVAPEFQTAMGLKEGTEVGGKMDEGTAPGIFYDGHVIYAQSRKRIISPGKARDNFGFAGFVRDNARELIATLGEGRHFGEWYGHGIQRGYGLDEKRFALFNVERWTDTDFPDRIGVVPVLYTGKFSEAAVQGALDDLRLNGSKLVYSVLNWAGDAEGVVVYHCQANTAFKITLDNDGIPKGQVRHANAQA